MEEMGCKAADLAGQNRHSGCDASNKDLTFSFHLPPSPVAPLEPDLNMLQSSLLAVALRVAGGVRRTDWCSAAPVAGESSQRAPAPKTVIQRSNKSECDKNKADSTNTAELPAHPPSTPLQVPIDPHTTDDDEDEFVVLDCSSNDNIALVKPHLCGVIEVTAACDDDKKRTGDAQDITSSVEGARQAAAHGPQLGGQAPKADSSPRDVKIDVPRSLLTAQLSKIGILPRPCAVQRAKTLRDSHSPPTQLRRPQRVLFARNAQVLMPGLPPSPSSSTVATVYSDRVAVEITLAPGIALTRPAVHPIREAQPGDRHDVVGIGSIFTFSLDLERKQRVCSTTIAGRDGPVHDANVSEDLWFDDSVFSFDDECDTKLSEVAHNNGASAGAGACSRDLGLGKEELWLFGDDELQSDAPLEGSTLTLGSCSFESMVARKVAAWFVGGPPQTESVSAMLEARAGKCAM
uniref:Uncharacterized protein n=1 Tax=Mycena chlorophos TaxID=658473 RepID=A0ABQ0KVZ6_MYCCL|nr:predicted protein [Mycena chlorophos]